MHKGRAQRQRHEYLARIHTFLEWFEQWKDELLAANANLRSGLFLQQHEIIGIPEVSAFLIGRDDLQWINEENWLDLLPAVELANEEYGIDIRLEALYVIDEKIPEAAPFHSGAKHWLEVRLAYGGPGPWERSEPAAFIAASDITFAKARSAFFCASCNTAVWFPEWLGHSCFYDLGQGHWPSDLCCPPGYRTTNVRILNDIGLDVECALSVAQDLGAAFLCARCDERVAQPMSFSQLVSLLLSRR